MGGQNVAKCLRAPLLLRRDVETAIVAVEQRKKLRCRSWSQMPAGMTMVYSTSNRPGIGLWYFQVPYNITFLKGPTTLAVGF